MIPWARVAALGAVAILAGCIGLEPDVGDPLRDLCINEDSDPDTDVSFSRDIVQGIFADETIACVDCHTPEGPTPLGIEVGGLNLSSFGDLLAGGVVSGRNIVIPSQPCDSILLQKVSAGPPFGARMPLDGAPLDAEQRQLISDWIAEGAREN